MNKRKPRGPQAAVETKNEESPPDLSIASFITNHNNVAHVIATGPKDRRHKVVHFTLPNGSSFAATIGAVIVLRELCDQVIRNCGTDILFPQQNVLPTKERT